MTSNEAEQFISNIFAQAKPRLTRLVGRLVEVDAEAVVDEAAAIFEGMIPDMAYLDRPDDPMAAALFICNVNLAAYLAVKSRGVDEHQFGKAMLTGLMRAPVQPESPMDGGDLQERFAQFAEAAEASQKDPRPGEFVFEAVPGERNEFDWGYDVTSCAICAAFSKYDAMDLVPYMCATDDVMSDKGDQGLKRTGSIAVGAHRCDFRYKRGGEPQRLAQQYPERIQLVARD